jgi:coproporphyrinogen III oxidase-like Fe-S oxidoreductase
MGASSQAYGKRFKNDDKLSRYIERVRSTGRGVMNDEAFDPAQEYVLLGLRTDTGIEMETFQKRFGHGVFDIFPKLKAFVDRRHLVIEDGRLCLTEAGMIVSNRILLSLF